jgi:undecaprenyl-diphosphatase
MQLTSHRSDPVFTPRRGGAAARFGDRISMRHPVTAAIAVWIVGFAVLSVVLVGLGLLLTHVLAPMGATHLDTSVSGWFVAHRTPTLDTASAIGSDLGSTVGILGLATVAAIALAIGRHWRQIGFIACALTLETSVFLLSVFTVDRPRPAVSHLDAFPPTSSYPSGHTAAAIALYAGLAIVIWSLVRSTLIRTIAWVIAVAVPVFVGASRIYRGMHHLTDVLASVLLGCGALLFALLVVRTAVAVSEERDGDIEAQGNMRIPLEAAS